MPLDYTNPNIPFPRIEARIVQTEFGYFLTARLWRNAYGDSEIIFSNLFSQTEQQARAKIERYRKLVGVLRSDVDMTFVPQ